MHSLLTTKTPRKFSLIASYTYTHTVVASSKGLTCVVFVSYAYYSVSDIPESKLWNCKSYSNEKIHQVMTFWPCPIIASWSHNPQMCKILPICRNIKQDEQKKDSNYFFPITTTYLILLQLKWVFKYSSVKVGITRKNKDMFQNVPCSYIQKVLISLALF